MAQVGISELLWMATRGFRDMGTVLRPVANDCGETNCSDGVDFMSRFSRINEGEKFFNMCRWEAVHDDWGLILLQGCAIYVYPLFICLYVLFPLFTKQGQMTQQQDIGCQSAGKKTVPMTLLYSSPSWELNYELISYIFGMWLAKIYLFTHVKYHMIPIWGSSPNHLTSQNSQTLERFFESLYMHVYTTV